MIDIHLAAAGLYIKLQPLLFFRFYKILTIFPHYLERRDILNPAKIPKTKQKFIDLYHENHQNLLYFGFFLQLIIKSLVFILHLSSVSILKLVNVDIMKMHHPYHQKLINFCQIMVTLEYQVFVHYI